MSIVSSEMCVLSKLYGGGRNTTSFAKVWLKKGPFSSGHPMLITSDQKASLKHSCPIPIAKWFSSMLFMSLRKPLVLV